MNKQQKDRTVNSFATGISLPLRVLETVDSIRKDVPRSRFILRLIEQGLNLNQNQKEGALVTHQHQQDTTRAGGYSNNGQRAIQQPSR
jgi:hypothetical protein